MSDSPQGTMCDSHQGSMSDSHQGPMSYKCLMSETPQGPISDSPAGFKSESKAPQGSMNNNPNVNMNENTYVMSCCRACPQLGTQTISQTSTEFFSNRFVKQSLNTIELSQDNVIMRSIKKQLPGLLPSPGTEDDRDCNCGKVGVIQRSSKMADFCIFQPFVKMERKPSLMLKYESQPSLSVKMERESIETQTDLGMEELESLLKQGDQRLDQLEEVVEKVSLEPPPEFQAAYSYFATS